MGQTDLTTKFSLKKIFPYSILPPTDWRRPVLELDRRQGCPPPPGDFFLRGRQTPGFSDERKNASLCVCGGGGSLLLVASYKKKQTLFCV